MRLSSVLLVLLGSLAPVAARAGAIEDTIAERTKWVPLALHEDACPADDLKACTKACTSAAFAAATGKGGPRGACVTMGDHWADGRAAGGKPNPKAALRSYYDACYLGDALGCEKEAASYAALEGKPGKSGLSPDQEMAIAVAASACLRVPIGDRGAFPVCRQAAELIERLHAPVEAEPYLVRWHVAECDDRGAQASCDWISAHGSPAIAAHQDAVADARRLPPSAGGEGDGGGGMQSLVDHLSSTPIDGLRLLKKEEVRASRFTNTQILVPFSGSAARVVVASPDGTPEVFTGPACSTEGAADTLQPMPGAPGAWGSASSFPDGTDSVCVTVRPASGDATLPMTVFIYAQP